MNMSTYCIFTLSLFYTMKLLVKFGIKIYRKLPSYLTLATSAVQVLEMDRKALRLLTPRAADVAGERRGEEIRHRPIDAAVGALG